MTLYSFTAELHSDMFMRPAYRITLIAQDLEYRMRKQGCTEGYSVGLQRTNYIQMNSNNGDARDIFAILGMRLKKGDRIQVNVDGPSQLEDELRQTGASIAEFLQQDFRRQYFPKDAQLIFPLS